MNNEVLPDNKEITYLGYTTFRDKNKLFGIKRGDRRQHVYILGKSGTGKSSLVSNMMIQNIQNGEGVCVVDPHGELVESVLSAIPEERMKDVVYFNPADIEYHMGFNVLELVDPRYKHLVASGLMGIFTKIWSNVWSARMEYIMNNAILALLDTPGSTLLGITRMLVDKDYRQKVVDNVKDPVIKAFWVHEYESWQDRFRNEAIAPIQNKVGQFLSTSIIRNVVGQSKSTINVFDIMNEGKIFLVNVSKGRIGEDNSKLLGGMIITKLQLAAMERVRIPEAERKDFYLYVDEFQNFVTDAFASILSEARKYRLNLTVAHQYIAQLVSDKNSAVRDAIFGNVGTMIVFRVGADDADFLEGEFSPEFTPEDIVALPNYKIYLKLMIDGITSRPFSAKTIPPLIKEVDKEKEERVAAMSRKLYCRTKESIENEINKWSGISMNKDGSLIGAGEKYEVSCSICKTKTTVPFKPEPGRPVYCRDCIKKIKEGELKPLKRINLNEASKAVDKSKDFYKPLEVLGIEFKPKKTNTPGEPSLKHKKTRLKPRSVLNKKNFKLKDDVLKKKISKPNSGLKNILSKTLGVDVKNNKPIEDGVKVKEGVKNDKFISLENLSKSEKLPSSKVMDNKNNIRNDRSAKQEHMSELKNLINSKTKENSFLPKLNKKEKPAERDSATESKDTRKQTKENPGSTHKESKKVEPIYKDNSTFDGITPPRHPQFSSLEERLKKVEAELKENREYLEKVNKNKKTNEDSNLNLSSSADLAKKEVPEEVLRQILEE